MYTGCEATRLVYALCPEDDRDILTAACHHPVTAQRWMLQRQPCQPLKHLTACLCVHGGSVPADTQPSLVSTDSPKEEAEWVTWCACLCFLNQVVIYAHPDCRLWKDHGMMRAAKVRFTTQRHKLGSSIGLKMLFAGQKLSWNTIACHKTILFFLALGLSHCLLKWTWCRYRHHGG